MVVNQILPVQLIKIKTQISKVKNENQKAKRISGFAAWIRPIGPNSKSQILISKQIPNNKSQFSKLIKKMKNLIRFGIWEIGKLGFVWDLDIRISDLKRTVSPLG